MTTLGELAGPDHAQADRDEKRLSKAIADHAAEHGCENLNGCPIFLILAQAQKDLMLYQVGLLKEAGSRHDPLPGFVETARRKDASSDATLKKDS